MTNSAIRHIGIITKYNYQSLMNHIGSGQEWDLELGEGGLEFLTPFAMGHNGSYRGKLEALDSAMNFLKISTEEYVVLADSGVLCAINLEKIVEAHAASGADVTVVVKDGICNGQKQLDLAVKVDADDRRDGRGPSTTAQASSILPPWACSSSAASCSCVRSRRLWPTTATISSATLLCTASQRPA